MYHRSSVDTEVHIHEAEDAVWVHQRQGAPDFGDLALFEDFQKGISISVGLRTKATGQP